MNKKKNTRTLRQIRIATMASLCVIASFAVGIHTAPDFHPIASMEAGAFRGDFTDDGLFTLEDVVTLLEILRDAREPTPHQLRADPNLDGTLTLDDAITLLHTLAKQ